MVDLLKTDQKREIKVYVLMMFLHTLSCKVISNVSDQQNIMYECRVFGCEMFGCKVFACEVFQMQ